MSLNSLPYKDADKSKVKNYDLNTNIRVIEVFQSIDGEQPRMGEITTFVRLAGCNLHCTYCDTAESQSSEAGYDMTVKDLVKHINSTSNNRNVTITGGEPLLQIEAVEELCQRLNVLDYKINIESNGTFNPTTSLLNTVQCFVYDYKSPELFKVDKLNLRINDIIKCVINSRAAFEVVKRVAEEYKYTKVYVGCVNGEEASLKELDLIEMILASGLPNLHFNTQLHKKVGIQ